MGHQFKAARRDPALRLIVDGVPRRELGGHVAPRGAGPRDPAQRVEHGPQLVRALRGIGAHQGQVGCDERPLVVAHRRWVGVRLLFIHPLTVPCDPRSP